MGAGLALLGTLAPGTGLLGPAATAAVGPTGVLLYVALAGAALYAAYRIDSIRNETGQGLWRVVRDRIGGTSDPLSSRPGRARGGRAGMAVLTIAVVAVAGLIIGWAQGDDTETATADPVEMETSGVTSEDSDLAVEEAVDAAVAVSQEAFPDGAPNVVLTRAGASVDALAAGGMQGLLGGPLLLTGPDGLAPETSAEIERLGNPAVHMLGGTSAISEAVAEQLAAAGHDMHRHSGPTGLETAIDIAERHFPEATAAVLAPTYGAGDDAEETLARAVSAGAFAAARNIPLLFTEEDELSQVTADYLDRAPISEVYVVGGNDVVGAPVMENLGARDLTVTRFEATDRFAMAETIATSDVFTGDGAILVGSGPSLWPGGFVAASYAARDLDPVLLTDGDRIPEATARALSGMADGADVRCMSGVTEAACAQAQELTAAG